MLRATFLALPVAAMATPLTAGDGAPHGSDWTGPYVGAQIGYALGSIGDAEPHGVVSGVHAGYLVDTGSFVYGAELEGGIVDVSSEGNNTFDILARLTARAGVDMGRSLVYATAGGVYTLADHGAGPNAEDFGWVVGVGVDYQWRERWVVGVEYLYNEFDELEDTGLDTNVHSLSLRLSYRF